MNFLIAIYMFVCMPVYVYARDIVFKTIKRIDMHFRKKI